jgi:hypothetical protein
MQDYYDDGSGYDNGGGYDNSNAQMWQQPEPDIYAGQGQQQQMMMQQQMQPPPPQQQQMMMANPQQFMGNPQQSMGDGGMPSPFGGSMNQIQMAGLLLASGMPFDRALVTSAQLENRNSSRSLQNYKRQREIQKEMVMQQGMSMQDPAQAFNYLAQSGFYTPHELAALRDVIASRPVVTQQGMPNYGQSYNQGSGQGYSQGSGNYSGGPQTMGQEAGGYNGGYNQRGAQERYVEPEQIDIIRSFQRPMQPLEAGTERNLRLREENGQLKELREATSGIDKARLSIDVVKKALPKFTPGLSSPVQRVVGNVALGFTGGATDLGTNAAAIETVESTLPTLMQPFYAGTKGAISDRENKTFAQGVPSATKTREASENIIAAMEAGYDKVEQKNLAAKAYRRKFKTLDGFDEKWEAYIEDPNSDVIKQDKDGKIFVDRSGLKRWYPYVLGEPTPEQKRVQRGDSLAQEIGGQEASQQPANPGQMNTSGGAPSGGASQRSIESYTREELEAIISGGI